MICRHGKKLLPTNIKTLSCNVAPELNNFIKIISPYVKVNVSLLRAIQPGA